MKNCSKIVWFVLLLVATSCSAHKKMVKPEQPQSFEWLTAKLDIEAESNGTVYNDLTGQLRMRKDSIVWLSVSATMGVEVLRAKITNDSVWILNRMEKTYLAGSADSLFLQYGGELIFNLRFVQHMLLGNIEGIPPVENQTAGLNHYDYYRGDIKVKLKYITIKLDEPTTFPLKITDKMEPIKLKRD